MNPIEILDLVLPLDLEETSKRNMVLSWSTINLQNCGLEVHHLVKCLLSGLLLGHWFDLGTLRPIADGCFSWHSVRVQCCGRMIQCPIMQFLITSQFVQFRCFTFALPRCAGRWLAATVGDFAV